MQCWNMLLRGDLGGEVGVIRAKYVALFLTGRGGTTFNSRGLGDLARRGWVIFVRYAERSIWGVGGKCWYYWVLMG